MEEEQRKREMCDSLKDEESTNPVACVTLHTPIQTHLVGLIRQALMLDIKLTIYQSGNHWCVNVSKGDMQKLIVIMWKQHIWVLANQDGYKVQVGRGSYQALMEIRPDVVSIVHEAMELQDQLDHRKQGLLPQPYCPQYYQCQAMCAYQHVPVYGLDGTIVAFQRVAPYPPLYA